MPVKGGEGEGRELSWQGVNSAHDGSVDELIILSYKVVLKHTHTPFSVPC